MLSDSPECHDPALLPELVEEGDDLAKAGVDCDGSSAHGRTVASVERAAPLLLSNLAALRTVDPTLFERISWPCEGDHLALADDGTARYRIHRSWHPLSLNAAQVEESLSSYRPDEPLFLLGLGLGEILAGAAARTTSHVDAWERDPWLLRQVLSRRDWTVEIRSGVVRFWLTSDLLGLIEGGTPSQVVTHPFLGSIYRHEAILVQEGVGERRALLGPGALFEHDVADALRAQGMSVIPWDLTRWSREELGHVAAVVGADVAVHINYTRGLAEACAEMGVPLRVWEIDPSTDVLPSLHGAGRGSASRGARVGTWRQAHVEIFEAAGFGDVRFLPLAANTARRAPRALSDDELGRYSAPVTFVGASMVDRGLAFRRQLVAAYVLGKGGDPGLAISEAEAGIDAVLAAQSEDFSTYRVPELLAAALPSFNEPITNHAVQMALKGARPDALLGEMAAADKRIAYVANLGQVGVHVWGDSGWRHVEKYGAVVRGPAGHGAELTRIYNTDSIHLDVGRIYQSDIVTMRVFDVLACGGFCLAEYSPGLEDLFELGVELDCYRTLDELLEKVEYWLDAGPQARREVGRAGRERVLRDHTVAHRITALMAP